MGRQVTLSAPTPSARLWLTLLRLGQRVGAPGLFGLGLLIVAAAVAAGTWTRHRAHALEASALGDSTRSSPSALPKQAADRPAHIRWPSVRHDVPLLLQRIERTAVEHGLGWPRADYRVDAATGESPDKLEVRCVLKGPYRSVRAFVSSLLLDHPTLTLREFSASRANSDAADVEAKLSIVVFLSPGAGHADGAPR